MIRVILLDAMGVIFESGDDVNELLVPFLRDEGATLSDRMIADAYMRASLGSISSDEFWKNTLGEKADPVALTSRYVKLHKMAPNVRSIAKEIVVRGARLGCVSNDVAEWAAALRNRHKLDDLFEHWVVSSDVEVRKPDKAIFDAALRLYNVSAAECLFVDDRVANVEAAAEIGLRAALLSGRDDRAVGGGDAARAPVDHFSNLEEVLEWIPVKP